MDENVENVTPVLKRTATGAKKRLLNDSLPQNAKGTPVSAFDDSFVQFSNIKEETEMEEPELKEMDENVTPVLKRTATGAKKRLLNLSSPQNPQGTPVSAFDDSFVQFSNIKEEPEMDETEPEIKVNAVTSKSLYGATQLASMIGNTSSDAVLDKPNIIKTEPDLFTDSHGHFDSFLRDLSDHDMSAPKSKLRR